MEDVGSDDVWISCVTGALIADPQEKCSKSGARYCEMNIKVESQTSMGSVKVSYCKMLVFGDAKIGKVLREARGGSRVFASGTQTTDSFERDDGSTYCMSTIFPKSLKIFPTEQEEISRMQSQGKL